MASDTLQPKTVQDFEPAETKSDAQGVGSGSEAAAATLAAAEESAAARHATAAAASTANDKMVACNTARAKAYGTARSEADFIQWIKDNPCPEGTDIGDGYWSVGR